MTNYYERIYHQFNSELDEYLESDDLHIKNRAAQAACITREVTDELARKAPGAKEYAAEMEQEIKRRLQEIRTAIALIMRCPKMEKNT